MEINNILQHLFKKPSLEEVPLADLQEMVAKYPYFAAGHFLLSKKLKQDDDPGFTTQLQKTNLYFHNTLWLHFSLQDEKPYNSAFAARNEQAKPVTGTVEELPPDKPEAQVGSVDEDEQVTASPGSDEIHLSIIAELDKRRAMQEELVAAQAVNEEAGIEVPENEVFISETQELASINDTQDPDEPKIVETETSAPAAIAIPEPEKLQPVKTEAPLSFAKSFKEAMAQDELAFDPYHTIDYFASLGIKLSQDPKPDDKLGRQLKSFTAWLKTMRRLPEVTNEPIEVNQADLNAHIEKIASHSLLDKEVITQAMAEVLTMQGNKEKAAEIYRKLSLQNPDKSTYFAAKIEELKQN